MSRQAERAARRAARAEARQTAEDSKNKSDEVQLPPLWAKVQSAIWLLGLAFLFWRGWIFPGILVLIAISGLTQAAILYYVKQQEETVALTQVREVTLPETCPNCGGPVTAATVKWTGRTTAVCPFCGSTIKAREAPKEVQAA